MSTQDPMQNPYGYPPSGSPDASAQYGSAAETAYSAAPGQVPPAGRVPPGYSHPGYPPAPLPGAPNPLLAGLLGFIPGVGAMYNGQFAKGIAHIVIFAVFESLATHTADVLGLLVAGWEFYMAFDAYHTARARRDGLPLPDPFGLNNIGERFGFRGNPDFSSFWHHVPTGSVPPVDPAASTVPGSTYQVDPAGNVYRGAGTAPFPGQPQGSYPPPSSAYPPPPFPYPPPSAYPPPYPPPPAYGMPPMPPVPPVYSARRGGLPTGAIWLIGLGLFALLGSIHPFAFLEGEVTGGLLLIGLSGWLFWRRYSVTSDLYPAGSPAARWNTLRASRGAAAVFVVGLLTLLQGLHVVAWEASWPFLLIAIGVLALAERFSLNAMNGAGYAQAYPGYAPGNPVGSPDTPAESAPVETSSPTSIVPKYSGPTNDLTDREGR